MLWGDDQTEPMSRDQEVIEFAAWRAGDEMALDRICRSNLRFVRQVVQKYSSYGLDLETLESAGLLGLINAAHRYQPERGYKFYTYAVHWIKQAIRMELSHNRLVRVPDNVHPVIFRISRERQQGDGVVAIPAHLGSHVLEAMAVATQNPISLDDPFMDSDDSMGDRLHGDAAHVKIEGNTEQAEVRTNIISRLAGFPERTAYIVARYYGIAGQEEPGTLEEIGEELGITRERVRQIRDAALRQMGADQQLARHWRDMEAA